MSWQHEFNRNPSLRLAPHIIQQDPPFPTVCVHVCTVVINTKAKLRKELLQKAWPPDIWRPNTPHAAHVEHGFWATWLPTLWYIQDLPGQLQKALDEFKSTSQRFPDGCGNDEKLIETYRNLHKTSRLRLKTRLPLHITTALPVFRESWEKPTLFQRNSVTRPIDMVSSGHLLADVAFRKTNGETRVVLAPQRDPRRTILAFFGPCLFPGVGFQK